MGENIGGGVEIECWREVVPVLFHEARRLTVHIQFRSIKFSALHREYHIKLSSEEDHCFLYKTAVTQDVYQRFAHYHSLDVPFEQFSVYMHHLVHSVKNNHDYGDRFFINILAPQTIGNLPQSIEFIVTQRQMGCVVQCRRLSLTFSLASDTELKEHLISGFERLKREKDVIHRRCLEYENELSKERMLCKELEDRNRYLQRELDFSQSLLRSAETLQKHYESLLHQQGSNVKSIGTTLQQHPSSIMEQSALHHPGGGCHDDSNKNYALNQSINNTNQALQSSASAPVLNVSNQQAIDPIDNRPQAQQADPLMGLNLFLEAVDLEQQQHHNALQHQQMMTGPFQQPLHEQPMRTVNIGRHYHQMTTPAIQQQQRPIRKDASVIAPPSFHQLMAAAAAEQHPQQHPPLHPQAQPPLEVFVSPSSFRPHGQQRQQRSITPMEQGAKLPATPKVAPQSQTSQLDAKPALNSPNEASANRPDGQNTNAINNIATGGADTKKLIGAAKRKASFHNMTNNSSSSHHTTEYCDRPRRPLATNDVTNHEINNSSRNTTPHLQQRHENLGHHGEDALMIAATTLASLPGQQNFNVMKSSATPAPNFCGDQSSNVVSINAPNVIVPSYHDAAVVVVNHHSSSHQIHHAYLHHDTLSSNQQQSLSPTLGSANNELIDGLSELTDADWQSIKIDCDVAACAPLPADLAELAPPPSRGSASAFAAPAASPSVLYATPSPRGSAFAAAATSPNVLYATPPPRDGSSPPLAAMDGVLSYLKCLICDRSFSTNAASHMMQHVTESRSCSVCAANTPVFDTNDDLIKHMLSHSTRIYSCQYCGKENPRVHYLKIHVRSHTGEKPYTCHQCGRGFADASTWRRHERVHTGEKPFQCNICGRKIARRDNVKIHMRSHMKSSKHHASTCRTCGKGFHQPNHLLLHERMCCSPSSGAEGGSTPGVQSGVLPPDQEEMLLSPAAQLDDRLTV